MDKIVYYSYHLDYLYEPKIINTEVLDRVKDLPLNQGLLLKLMQDILAIESAHNMQPNCQQYVLLVKKADLYPILQTTHDDRHEIKGLIWLNVGDVWRYGSTAFGEEKRYADKIFFISKDGKTILSTKELEYQTEYRGKMMDVLIAEKIKIYSYPLLPECIARVKIGKQLLLKSPGNKVYK